METLQAAPPIHIFREQNKVADELARLGLVATSFGITHIFSSPPPTLVKLVQDDLLGTTITRKTSLNYLCLVRRGVATDHGNFSTLN